MMPTKLSDSPSPNKGGEGGGMKLYLGRGRRSNEPVPEGGMRGNEAVPGGGRRWNEAVPGGGRRVWWVKVWACARLISIRLQMQIEILAEANLSRANFQP